MNTYVAAFAIALVISFLLTPYVKKLAFKIGAVDKPDERKVHTRVMPRLGGLAIFVAFLLSVVVTMGITNDVLGILLGSLAIVVVGILDDKYQLPAKVKLLGQIGAACILVLFDIRIEWLNNPVGGYFYLDYLSVPFTVFWVVSFTNVVNLMDGLDGLAAGVSAIASITIIIVALQESYFAVAALSAALAGAIIGFLRYNFNPATIFMGDTGSMFIGYTLAAISIFGAVKSAATIALVVPAIALGLPIMDTAFAIIRRKINGKPIFKPDKGHLHHRLLALGLSQRQVVLLMYLVSALLGTSAILLTEIGGLYSILLVSAIVAVVGFCAKKIGILNDR
ncbi:MAG TPA: undecaprenyl/decaprenyl-phosphate alpha-N-acetylglucosaminyl 1-phosphate transferase [Candidatus Avacidaminococcus intestinavium]|uniref:Undecaprenyl/decaprenyl-phosphate alpha-N-acetylglucosaminyl 1-phosphate transferase n=1 Tax=Candidatus Avacidaminococcus intestinavium TaxID=2840684 RepID=A0A9D1MQK7_9FIRM|nr:undecaprenyl/decaprenyl-phosphate alpha-N-acetylglucosaminyl 1-phosphate transferase [Candidatus Avacidaminococcus intestinavium]